MPLTYAYHDAFLKGQITDEREARAIADVLDTGITSADWSERLTILRAYIIVCLECQAQADDLFAQKLKHYRSEFDQTLLRAIAATPAPDGSARSPFIISTERG